MTSTAVEATARMPSLSPAPSQATHPTARRVGLNICFCVFLIILCPQAGGLLLCVPRGAFCAGCGPAFPFSRQTILVPGLVPGPPERTPRKLFVYHSTFVETVMSVHSCPWSPEWGGLSEKSSHWWLVGDFARTPFTCGFHTIGGYLNCFF